MIPLIGPTPGNRAALQRWALVADFLAWAATQPAHNDDELPCLAGPKET